MHITGKRLQSKFKTKHTPEKAKIYETSFNSFCVLFEDQAEQLWHWKQLKTIYGLSIRRAFVEIGTYCGRKFHGPSWLLHSFWAEVIMRTFNPNVEWKQEIPEKKTTNYPPAMGVWILDYLNLDYLIHASGANMLSLISKKVEFRAKKLQSYFSNKI